MIARFIYRAAVLGATEGSFIGNWMSFLVNWIVEKDIILVFLNDVDKCVWINIVIGDEIIICKRSGDIRFVLMRVAHSMAFADLTWTNVIFLHES